MSAPLIAYKVVDNQRHLFSEGAQSVYWPRFCVDVQAGVYLPRTYYCVLDPADWEVNFSTPTISIRYRPMLNLEARVSVVLSNYRLLHYSGAPMWYVRSLGPEKLFLGDTLSIHPIKWDVRPQWMAGAC